MTATSLKPSVSTSEFICCYSQEDGGAVDIQHSIAPSQNSNTITDCRFCSNTALNGYGNAGGAICIWENSPVPGLTNCLLSHSTSMSYGGALYVHFKVSTQRAVRFSLFVDNYCQANNGHDVYSAGSSTDAFIHCFSTTQLSPRTYPSEHDNDWLPSVFFI